MIVKQGLLKLPKARVEFCAHKIMSKTNMFGFWLKLLEISLTIFIHKTSGKGFFFFSMDIHM